MPLLGTAALLLSFDVAPEVVAEHDRWHTQEHLPERLAIPGFLRGTRWVAVAGGPRYLVLYEVADLAVLAGPDYLARLNAPSPWTQALMPHYRGMRRGLCRVRASVGPGLGGEALLLRFAAPPERAEALAQWLADEGLPALVQLPGLGSAHLLEAAAPAAMTREQRLRGADLGFDAALVVTGYDGAALGACAARLAGPGGLPDRGAVLSEPVRYRGAYLLEAAGRAPAAGAAASPA
ncbi:DUF4286 family protein [Piscinibacter sakaiensis]|uniref:Uncharacterized protein n=1 Tax=Piscinibacter sakaiensis TaxID=1547922 RepID=A0A0K8P7K9_PISS1|nr:DUF4286 family protein [Piscinibacter sakaiensis]GAP38155.1 hypothetical protein ISF6_4349 [Piscinibacter sakaiensis]